MPGTKTKIKNKKEPNRGGKLGRFLKFSARFLTRARDFYVRSLNHCGAVAGYGTAMGCPAGQVGSGLPRSFSAGPEAASRSDEDYRALLRLASLKNLTDRIESDLARGRPGTMPAPIRSCSVGGLVGRIDEDEPCEFGDVKVVVVEKDMIAFPRSGSYAGSRKARLLS